MVWKLDRLGRSLQHLMEIVTWLDERKVQPQSLTQGINTRTASGRTIFGIMADLAEFERELTSERPKLAALRRMDKNKRWRRPLIFQITIKSLFSAAFSLSSHTIAAGFYIWQHIHTKIKGGNHERLQ